MKTRALPLRSCAIAVCAVLCTGCGGGSGAAPVQASSAGASFTARFAFTLPPAGGASQAQRRLTYISPSSQSLEIDVVSGSTTTVGTKLNLSPLPSTCTNDAGVTACEVAVVAQTGVTSFVITFYDQANEQGNVLSTVTVPAPAAVNGVATISATLLPVVASIQLVPVTPLINGQPATTPVTVTALDADGNVISGGTPFSTPIQLVPASTALVFTPGTLTSPATAVSVNYSGAPNASTQVTADAGPTSFVTQLPIVAAAPNAITIAPADLQLTVGGPGAPIVISQASATGTIALTATCSAGAAITLSQATVPAGTSTSVAVTPVSAPTSAVTHACTIVATSGTQSTTGFVDVNQNTATVDSRARSAR